MTPLERIFSTLSNQWGTLSGAQRLVFLSMVVAFAISVFVFSTWLRKPDMVLLASDLDPAVAADVIKEVEQRGAAYEVTDGGRTILVDRDMVSELRINLASTNVLSSSSVGYELFDNERIGITDFAQKINLQRALEGELSRTISELKAIDRARVHIALPKETVFTDEQRQPTASVIVKIKPGFDLTSRQIQGIANLVSFSIDGLDAGFVSIVDDGGNVLKGETDEGANVAHFEDQRAIESYLSDKAVRLLSGVVGRSKARVAINANLNWERVQSTKESYDPAKSVVRSEERNESNSDTDGSTTESSVTNYEVDKTIENVLSAVGTIKNLSIAVFVDHAEAVDAQGAVTYTERPATELSQLEDIVKNAVGFDENRGDNITVVNMRFNDAAPLLESPGLFGSPIMQTLPSILGRVAMVAIVLILLLRLRKNMTLPPEGRPLRLPAAMTGGGGGEQHSGVAAMAGIPGDAIEEQVRGVATSSPENVAKLMKSWMVDQAET